MTKRASIEVEDFSRPDLEFDDAVCINCGCPFSAHDPCGRCPLPMGGFPPVGEKSPRFSHGGEDRLDAAALEDGVCSAPDCSGVPAPGHQAWSDGDMPYLKATDVDLDHSCQPNGLHRIGKVAALSLAERMRSRSGGRSS